MCRCTVATWLRWRHEQHLQQMGCDTGTLRNCVRAERENVHQDLSKEHELKPKREMLETLGQGRPNLIVCPEKEIHSTCLALYAINAKKPLPGKYYVNFNPHIFLRI